MRLDGRYLATEVAGGFTGRILGVGTVDGPARILRFAYTARCGTRPLVIA